MVSKCLLRKWAANSESGGQHGRPTGFDFGWTVLVNGKELHKIIKQCCQVWMGGGGGGRGGLVPEFYEFADSGWGHPKLGLGSTLDLQGRGGFKGIP